MKGAVKKNISPPTGHRGKETEGSRFLVLEFVEGETLAERIGHGRLGL